jgi:PTH1 family peptidyl-tRNA hydrolase
VRVATLRRLTPPRTPQTRGRRLLRGPLGGGGGAVDWLIVGLGNPGREYAGTRHNVGFMVAEELTRRWDLSRPKDRFRGRIAEGSVRPRDGEVPLSGPPAKALRVAVLCPQTFMNDAGRSVGPARGSFKLALDRVLVVHDEIDLPFGDVRTRVGGGLAGHNGLKSVRRELGSPDFARVRVGVGRPDSTDPEIVSAHVLGAFSEGSERVGALVDDACAHVEHAIFEPPDDPATAVL